MTFSQGHSCQGVELTVAVADLSKGKEEEEEEEKEEKSKKQGKRKKKEE